MRKEQRTSYPAVGIKHKSDSPGGLSPEFCILPCKTKLRRNEDFHLLFKFRKGFFYYDASKQFKDGALYVNGKTVTLDLNGHSIVHKNARKYDIISENEAHFEPAEDSFAEASGTIADLRSAVIEGNTCIYIRLTGLDGYFFVSAAADPEAVLLNVGDAVSLRYASADEGNALIEAELVKN